MEVCYLEEMPELGEGPFLKEERDLILNLSNLILGFINSIKAKEIIWKQDKKKEEYISIQTFHYELSCRRGCQYCIERSF